MIVMLVIASVSASTVPAQERDELLAAPKVDEDARAPSYQDLTADEVAAQITMVSDRNYAWFGFNQPEVHLVLPAADNSVYAVVEFADLRLLAPDGSQVPFELERGLYDRDSHHVEIRFNPESGEGPVEFARVVGTATVRYPLRIATLRARAGGPPVAGLDVVIDGPFVTRRRASDEEDLEAASFTGIEAFRALDGKGQVLEQAPSTRMSLADSIVTETTSYWGEVAEVELDTAEEWATFRVRYELPSVPPLPKERAGIAAEDGTENPPTAGAKIEVESVPTTAGTVIAAELGVTANEALGRLAELGFRSPDGDLMVMAAVQGKLEAVKLFLVAGVPIDFVTNDGRSALVSAIAYRHLDLASFLVEAGANVNLADSNNATPLFHAAGICDAVELVRALLAAGADPTPATHGNMTAAEMAGVMGCADNEAAIRAASKR
jgi:hypothetical protein